MPGRSLSGTLGSEPNNLGPAAVCMQVRSCPLTCGRRWCAVSESKTDPQLTPPEARVRENPFGVRTFGMTDRGRIKVGMRADLLLVDGDPSQQIRATRDIVAIWKRGIRLPGVEVPSK